MKDLYESILKSTQSGKDAVIIEWMKENLNVLEGPRSFVKGYENIKNNFFIKNSKICTVPDYKGWINLLKAPKGGNIELPDYIKFGECPKASFRLSSDRTKPDQYPDKCSELWVQTEKNKIKNLKLNVERKLTLLNPYDNSSSPEFKNIDIKTDSSEFTLEIYGFLINSEDINDIKITCKPGTKITLEFGGYSSYEFLKKSHLKTKEEINEFCNRFLPDVKEITRIVFEKSTSSVVFEKSIDGNWGRKKY